MNDLTTTAEVLNALTTTAADMADTRKELAEIEAAGDTATKALDAHGRLVSKLAILEATEAKLRERENSVRQAELKSAEVTAKEEFDAAEAVVKETKEKITKELGAFITNTRQLADAVDISAQVIEAKAAASRAGNAYREAAAMATRFNLEHFPRVSKANSNQVCPACGKMTLLRHGESKCGHCGKILM